METDGLETHETSASSTLTIRCSPVTRDGDHIQPLNADCCSCHVITNKYTITYSITFSLSIVFSLSIPLTPLLTPLPLTPLPLTPLLTPLPLTPLLTPLPLTPLLTPLPLTPLLTPLPLTSLLTSLPLSQCSTLPCIPPTSLQYGRAALEVVLHSIVGTQKPLVANKEYDEEFFTSEAGDTPPHLSRSVLVFCWLYGCDPSSAVSVVTLFLMRHVVPIVPSPQMSRQPWLVWV